MSVTVARFGAGLSATLLAFALSGCGTDAAAPAVSSAPTTSAPAAPATSAELVSKTAAAIGRAKSVRITGTGVAGGQSTSKVLAGTTDDTNGHYVISQKGSGRMEVILAEGSTYLTGDKAFWASQHLEAFGRAYLGKWLKSPAEQNAAGTTTVSNLLKDILTASPPDLLAPEVETSTVDGQPVFVWTHVMGKKFGQVFVAADGSWLPVKATTSSNEVFLYTDWDHVAPVEAPRADQVVDAALPG